MPYRDEAEARRVRIAALEEEVRALTTALERSHAMNSSVVAQLKESAPEGPTDWRSLPDGDPIHVTFVNRTDTLLTLAWFGFDGRLHEDATLIAEGRRRVESHTGSLWRASSAGIVRFQRYLARSDGEVVISLAGKPRDEDA